MKFTIVFSKHVNKVNILNKKIVTLKRKLKKTKKKNKIVMTE